VAVIVTLDQIQHLPNVRSSYREAFQKGQAVVDHQCRISERDYEAWARERLVIDTAGPSVARCVEAIRAALVDGIGHSV
jgi:hypothetical protein